MKIKSFNIEQIAESGQCFRWNKIEDMHYRGIIGNSVCEVKQVNDEVFFSGMSSSEFIKYFDLERDYEEIKTFYNKDSILKEAIRFGDGIRILNQNKFEILISFIVSANNNIPRIKRSVETISKRYGKHIYGDYYAFPTPIELGMADEEALKECGVGFRAKYIVNTCRSILDGFDLEKVSMLPLDECKKQLTSLMGVGAKVADCIMLFSMGKVEAFPVDVWVKKIMETLYLKEEKSLKEIETYSKGKFGKYAGVAQQYLFFYSRNNL